MAIAALVFDAYGTLYDVHSVVQRCDQYFPGKGAQLSQLWRSKQLEYTWLRSLMQRYVPFSTVTREALAWAADAQGLALTGEQTETLMREYLMLATYPDVAEALQRLKPAKQAILSNGSPDMLEPLVAHSRLAFDAVLSVDAVKIFKPSPRVYEIATKTFGVQPNEIAFVSSNCWDALGAQSFGFNAYWINRLGAPVDRLAVQPAGILKSLGDLPDVLRSSPHAEGIGR
jgi:2-haloacid dehalogenase